MGTLHDTAKAVRDLINSGSFTKSFEAVLSYDTDLLLEDAGDIHVDVVAGSLDCLADSRVSLQYACGIDVAVRYRFGVVEQGADGQIRISKIEEYLDLLEEIGEYLADPDNRALATKATAGWQKNDIQAPWVPEHIRTQRQYTGILRATYHVAKDL